MSQHAAPDNATIDAADRLPGALGDIARIAGLKAALAVAAERGGTEVYLPPAPGADHWLSRLVGHDAALAIADHFTCGVGPMRLELPSSRAPDMARKRGTVDRMIRDGRSERDIAMATGYTARGVRKRRAKLRGEAESGQMDFWTE